MAETIHTLVVGGGQAGLAMSYCLGQRGIEHQVLEKTPHLGHAWRDERWDSFTLVTPNWTWRLPGDEYAGPDPNGFMPRSEIVARLEQYAQRNAMPVRCGVTVTEVRPRAAGGFEVDTSDGPLTARCVVMAAGLFQRPKRPAGADGLPAGIAQLHSTQYRRPDALPPGAVLVVGSGQSGCQITEELYQAGRTVYQSTSTAGRVPRRFRGVDTFVWMEKTGFMHRTPDKLESPAGRFKANPHVTGKDGGHNLNLHQFARDGVRLLGRLKGADDGRVHLAPDLHANLAKADEFEAELVKGLNEYIAKAGEDAPEETLPALRDGYAVEAPTELNLAEAGITSIIWAAGYLWDFSLVRADIFDEYRYPIHRDGATAVPGLYFLGLPFLRSQGSGLFYGVGVDAALVAEHIGAAG